MNVLLISERSRSDGGHSEICRECLLNPLAVYTSLGGRLVGLAVQSSEEMFQELPSIPENSLLLLLMLQLLLLLTAGCW